MLFSHTVAFALALSSASMCLAEGESNILFIILDDVGADQLVLSNPAGVGLAPTPTINAIAAQGVNFTNCWSMPECSPSRVCFFTGRFPGRTGVGSPMTDPTLPQSQCSPFEATTPRLLSQVGYESALFGKFHLAQEDNNPAGLLAPSSVGFTRFNGTLLGAPPYIDPTIAGQVKSDEVLYSCGVPVAGNAPAICACAFQDGDCMTGVDALDCLTAGGMPLVAADGTPILTCDADAAARINWSKMNGSYAWPRTINEGNQASQISPVRVHADVDQAELAISFINEQRAIPAARWMCTLSFSGDHDPWQQPPDASLPPGTHWPAGLPYACSEQAGVRNSTVQERLLSNWTIQSLDTQIRRVLISTGLATTQGGALTLTAPDTIIVVVGDNGSFLTSVRAPFNPLRAKATAYQTGVCVPLIAAGGPTIAPGRNVDALVNIVDLFELFGEAAHVNVHAAVPEGRKLDSRPMLRYLTNPQAESARAYNYTEYFEPHLTQTCYPCLIAAGSSNTCTDTILTSESLCASQGGVWYGPTDSDPTVQATDCCDLWEQMNQPSNFSVIYAQQQAITDGHWKVVYSEQPSCLLAAGASEYEFFDLTQCFAAGALFGRGIDNPSFNLLASDAPPLTPAQSEAYVRLRAKLAEMNLSLRGCVGDISMNGQVNALDLASMLSFWGVASVADLNNDGVTSGPDLAMLLTNWGSCAD